jgi:hypothetical protein
MKKNAKNVVAVNTQTFGYEDVQLIQNSVLENRFRPTVNPLVAGLENASNLTTTANGALAYKSTLNSLVDFFGNGAALRNRSEADAIQLFTKAFAEDKLLALKTLFYIRDVRGGQGEKRVFRICMKWLSENYPDIFIKNIHNIPNFGRFDDLYCVF